jgi:hypothetical protein
MNLANQRKQSGTSSRYKGVSWRADRNKWTAYICPDRKKINLGVFNSEEDAARAYDSMAPKYFGEFARLNFPEVSNLVTP